MRTCSGHAATTLWNMGFMLRKKCMCVGGGLTPRCAECSAYGTGGRGGGVGNSGRLGVQTAPPPILWGWDVWVSKQPPPPHPVPGAVTRVVCPPGPPVYMDSRTAARAPRPGRPLGREALGAPRGPSNRPPRHRGRLVQPRAAPPVPVQSGSADRPQSCVGLGHPLPMAVVGSLRHVGRPGGGVSRPATPPVGSESGSPSLPTGAWSTRQHTAPRARTAPHAHHHTHSDQGTLVSCPG